MSRLLEQLENSRIAELIGKIESGQSVTGADLDRLTLLQPLDLIRSGQIAVAEAIRFQEEQDARTERLLLHLQQQMFPDRPTTDELVLSKPE